MLVNNLITKANSGKQQAKRNMLTGWKRKEQQYVHAWNESEFIYMLCHEMKKAQG